MSWYAYVDGTPVAVPDYCAVLVVPHDMTYIGVGRFLCRRCETGHKVKRDLSVLVMPLDPVCFEVRRGDKANSAELDDLI